MKSNPKFSERYAEVSALIQQSKSLGASSDRALMLDHATHLLLAMIDQLAMVIVAEDSSRTLTNDALQHLNGVSMPVVAIDKLTVLTKTDQVLNSTYADELLFSQQRGQFLRNEMLKSVGISPEDQDRVNSFFDKFTRNVLLASASGN